MFRMNGAGAAGTFDLEPEPEPEPSQMWTAPHPCLLPVTLVPYDAGVDGPPRGLVPLMAVRQNNQSKVLPVLDYRELNGFVTAHTVDADVCADQLRWRRHGKHTSVVDLRKAYLQLRLERRLWPFQSSSEGSAPGPGAPGLRPLGGAVHHEGRRPRSAVTGSRHGTGGAPLC